MSATPTPELATTIAAHTEQMQALCVILDEEHSRLQARDLPALDSVLQRKTQPLKAIEGTTRNLEQLLSAAGLSAERRDIDRLMKRSGLTTAWEQLATIAHQCQHLNAINRGIVLVGQSFAESMLGLLRGEPLADRVYGPAGRVNASGHALPLAKA